MILSYACLLVTLLAGRGGASPADSTPAPPSALTQAQLLADFALFKGIYQKANSGLYTYRTHRQIDSVFAANRALITPQTTLIEFYRLLYAVTDYTGSLHSDNYLPGEVDSLLRAETSFFPYPVQIIGGALLLNSTHAPLPLGSTLLTINGRPAKEIVRRLGRYATTDGDNQTGKAPLISRYFSFYYRLEFGPAAGYVLTYQPPGQTSVQRIQLPAVPYRSCQAAFNQRHSRPLEKSVPPYSFTRIDSLTSARLSVHTFELGGPGRTTHQRYARFLDSTFRYLRAHPQIRQLIVDVRQNDGGDDPNDLLLYSYLTRRRFRENKRAYTVFRRVPYPAYFVEEQPGERLELEAQLRAEHGPRRGGRYYEHQWVSPRWRPSPRAFGGKVLLLVGPRVASAGSLFASLVRSDRGSLVIGEETAGGYYGHTGHTPVRYRLPNTHIELAFSIIDLKQDVQRRARFPAGRGVMPDYVVRDDQTSFLANMDVALAYALGLIQSRQARKPVRGITGRFRLP